MTRDEIKLVVFILGALVIGALVQYLRTRNPPAATAPEAARHGWAKPPYVLKGSKEKRGGSEEAETR